MKRKIIQIVDNQDTEFTQGCITALCNDGTIWFFGGGKWELLNFPIPQCDVEG